MEIRINQLIEGARNAIGLTVIIDVFRAFSVACYVTNNGAERMIPVGDIDLAYKLKADNPEYVLIGERGEKPLEGFDYGNSPTHIEQVDFTGKTVVQTTSAGTQGIVNAVHADEIITGGLVNAQAIARYIRRLNPAVVSLVCMGNAGVSVGEEDTICADYIKSLLEEEPFDIESVVRDMKNASGSRFFRPDASSWAPERDFYLCTDVNRFNFVLQAKKDEQGLHNLQKIEV